MIWQILYVLLSEDYFTLKIIGSNIRRMRFLLGISQSQLAFETNTTLRQIQRIEKGETNAGILFYVKIAEVLQVDLSDLTKSSNSFK